MSDDECVALVTGGVQGLGAATAKLLSQRGCKVAVSHLGAGDKGDTFAGETGLPVFEWDVSDRVAC